MFLEPEPRESFAMTVNRFAVYEEDIQETAERFDPSAVGRGGLVMAPGAHRRTGGPAYDGKELQYWNRGHGHSQPENGAVFFDQVTA